jgi:hypothetical protein
MTTAIYPNRIEDKIKLEKMTRLTENGDLTTSFYFCETLIALGYNRVVYGDHGPYIEFERYHFKIELVSKFGHSLPTDLPSIEESQYYYYWLRPKGLNIKVYWQIKPVTNLPQAPKRVDGKPSKFNRKEGYADYKRNKYYVDPYEFSVIDKPWS